MSMARANTSITLINNRHAFIFNGLQPNAQTSLQTCIEYIDLGQLDARSLQQARWQ